ncbi:hypothetical protein AGMMS50230_08260 [Spirochaetia bacterium]|nr:hypothetical protein AGMMS50230_08260 [Spirochaetia bacterium]
MKTQGTIKSEKYFIDTENIDQRVNTKVLDQLFPEDAAIIMLGTHDDDIPIHAGCTARFLSYHRNTYNIVTLFDALGVFKDYCSSYMSETRNLDINQYNERQIETFMCAIRFNEFVKWVMEIPFKGYIHLAMEWRAKKLAYKSTGTYQYVDAFSSIFNPPKTKDKNKIKQTVKEYLKNKTIWFLQDPNALHPQHSTASTLFISAIKKFAPDTSIFLYSSRTEKLRPEQEEDDLILYFSDEAVNQNADAINRCFVSQNARHYDPLYYGKTAKELARFNYERNPLTASDRYHYAESFRILKTRGVN